MSVIFDQLRISDDGKRMYLDFHVNTASYFENVFLDSVTIMTSDKVSETDPHNPTTDYVYLKEYGDTEYIKSDSLVLESEDLVRTWETEISKMRITPAQMIHSLFFVYVKVKGTPSGLAPCGSDDEVTVGVTFNEGLIHQMIMGYTKELADTCNVPVGFADFILLWNAFTSAIRTGHYIQGIQFFNMLLDNNPKGNYMKSSKCGCHGRNFI